MKKIILAAFTFTLFACGDNTSTTNHGHDHAKESHKGHDHSSHEGHDNEDHKGHDHDAHKGHDHSSHEDHNKDAHKGHDHSSHEGHNHDAHKGHDHSEETIKGDGKHFGESISLESKTTVDGAIEVLTTMKAKVATVNDVTIHGTINEVCQSKGCWLTLNGNDGNSIMVKFKDYAFFAPKDCAGKMGTFHGVFSLEEQSVEELKNFAEDAGKSKEEIANITETKKVYSLMVDGFVLD